MIFGSVILFSSCGKQAKEATHIPSKASVTISDRLIKKGIKEDDLIRYMKSAPLIKPDKDNGAPFNHLDYDKIIAYDFEGDEEQYHAPIDRQGTFIPIIEKQQFLSQQQADRILKVLTKNSSYGEASAACFNPHLGLVFFKNNKKINQISICLDCNGSASEIDIPARRHRVFNKGTDDEYAFTGFTPRGKAAIIGLCKELKLHYQSAENTGKKNKAEKNSALLIFLKS